VAGDAVWVSNFDAGTVLRVHVDRAGRPGHMSTVVTGLPGVDDFAVLGTRAVIAAVLSADHVVVARGSRHVVLLSAADGLSNPTSVAIRGSSLYVTDGAYLTKKNPNLLRLQLGG